MFKIGRKIKELSNKKDQLKLVETWSNSPGLCPELSSALMKDRGTLKESLVK